MTEGIAKVRRACTVVAMNNQEQNTDPAVKIRPVTTIILTIIQALWTAILILSLNPIAIALGLISLLITLGLWRGQNTAWALVIIGSGILLVSATLSLDVVSITGALMTLTLALLPKTRAYYKPVATDRSQLSLRPKGILQVFGILAVGIIVIFFVAGLMS